MKRNLESKSFKLGKTKTQYRKRNFNNKKRIN